VDKSDHPFMAFRGATYNKGFYHFIRIGAIYPYLPSLC
jgi:hypothetical protein